ncbi:prepilin-type N-terminal cleavage/methylation domain-containing protein [Candidatus Parcubacteria bacterium]|nr:prepilin-type N-terminal cleavage/methylation domain-containing protein [Candidatus Parcubacteria bacterium]
MKAFTLIETLVVIFVFAITMGALTGFITRGYRVQSYSFQQSQAIEEAKRGVEIMVKEIREARTAEDGSYVVYNAGNNEFCFFSDIDKDLAIEKVRYFLDGSDFKKGIIEPVVVEGIATYSTSTDDEAVSILSQYVRNGPSIFKYFDINGEELPSPARRRDTRVMRFFLLINVDPNRPPSDFELESDVEIRNL